MIHVLICIINTIKKTFKEECSYLQCRQLEIVVMGIEVLEVFLP